MRHLVLVESIDGTFIHLLSEFSQTICSLFVKHTCLSTKTHDILKAFFLGDLHSFYHELVDMKEAFKAIKMLGHFPFS